MWWRIAIMLIVWLEITALITEARKVRRIPHIVEVMTTVWTSPIRTARSTMFHIEREEGGFCFIARIELVFVWG